MNGNILHLCTALDADQHRCAHGLLIQDRLYLPGKLNRLVIDCQNQIADPQPGGIGGTTGQNGINLHALAQIDQPNT